MRGIGTGRQVHGEDPGSAPCGARLVHWIPRGVPVGWGAAVFRSRSVSVGGLGRGKRNPVARLVGVLVTRFGIHHEVMESHGQMGLDRLDRRGLV